MTQEVCESCGATMIEYNHSINVGMYNAVVTIYSRNKQLPTKISDLLNHNQICNFQKLKYWGLVTKSDKSGFWSITDRCVRFLNGTIKIPAKITTYRGKVVFVDRSKYVTAKDLSFVWRKREDYLQS